MISIVYLSGNGYAAHILDVMAQKEVHKIKAMLRRDHVAIDLGVKQ